jgi:hypothetical protein
VYDDNDCQNPIQFSSYLDGFCYSSSLHIGDGVSSRSSFQYDFPSLSFYDGDTCDKKENSDDISGCIPLEDGTSTDTILLKA